MAFARFHTASAAVARLDFLSRQTDEFCFETFLFNFLQGYARDDLGVSTAVSAANDTYDLHRFFTMVF
jgi:hypothetical protein